MQRDFNDIGEANFSFEILNYLEPRKDMENDYTKELQTLENMWLEKLHPFNENGYNKKHF